MTDLTEDERDYLELNPHLSANDLPSRQPKVSNSFSEGTGDLSVAGKILIKSTPKPSRSKTDYTKVTQTDGMTGITSTAWYPKHACSDIDFCK